MAERISIGPVSDTFMELVKVGSPTFHEQEMASEVCRRLESFGLTPKIDGEGNVTTRFDGDPTKETFMLNAHMDTVQKIGDSIEPFVDDEGWIRSKGDTILGADNKTAVAAILYALEKLKKENSTTHHPLEIVFTVSEESGNHGAHGLNYQEISAKTGYIFDASDREFGSMVLSSPAYARFDMKMIGVASHASKPELAKNVLFSFQRGLSQTKLGWVDKKRTLVNIGVVSVGEKDGPVNTVPGELIASGEVRTMDGKLVEAIARKVVSNFEKEAEKDGVRVETKITKENGSFEFSKEDPLVQRTVEILNEMGISPSFVNSWGCYEANIFAEHGIMMLNLADGSLDSHTKDERIKVTDLEMLGELVYKLVS